MNEAIKKLWVDTLRSGTYDKGTGSLRVQGEDGLCKYCCLGVLTDIYCIFTDKPWKEVTNYSINEQYLPYEYLPPKVAEWAGLEKTNPFVIFRLGEASLSHINDICNYPFKEIAHIIEEQL